ncbi:uncharacterized protein lrrc63 [Cetorhinus maximus]
MIAATRIQENYFRHGISSGLPSYPGAVPNIEGREQFLESSDAESPVMEEEPEKRINPYEIFVLRSLAVGSDSLNFRGHFISQLPDLTALASTLKYLNLSFNSFQNIPAEIYGFSQLEVLNLRDNPITDISSDIVKLTNLRIFDISFCLVSTLPAGATICDCCKGPLYGPGLQLIKPHKTIFHTESLLFLFHACSPSCYKWFMSKAR